MLKASRFVQLELESGAWLTFFRKGFQKAPLVRGGGVGNSGHCGASRANPTLGDTPERSRPSLRCSKAASWGESRTPLPAVPGWHTRLAEMGPTVPPAHRTTPGLAATSTLLLLQERDFSCSQSDGGFPEPRVLCLWGAARLFAAAEVLVIPPAGWMSSVVLACSCCSTVYPLGVQAPVPCSSPTFTPKWVSQTPTSTHTLRLYNHILGCHH